MNPGHIAALLTKPVSGPISASARRGTHRRQPDQLRRLVRPATHPATESPGLGPLESCCERTSATPRPADKRCHSTMLRPSPRVPPETRTAVVAGPMGSSCQTSLFRLSLIGYLGSRTVIRRGHGVVGEASREQGAREFGLFDGSRPRGRPRRSPARPDDGALRPQTEAQATRVRLRTVSDLRWRSPWPPRLDLVGADPTGDADASVDHLDLVTGVQRLAVPCGASARGLNSSPSSMVRVADGRPSRPASHSSGSPLGHRGRRSSHRLRSRRRSTRFGPTGGVSVSRVEDRLVHRLAPERHLLRGALPRLLSRSR